MAVQEAVAMHCPAGVNRTSMVEPLQRHPDNRTHGMRATRRPVVSGNHLDQLSIRSRKLQYIYMVNEIKRILDNFARAKRSGYPLIRFDIVRLVARLILPHYRFKWPQMAWWQDPFFNAYLKKFNELDGMNTDRRWMLYQLMRLASDIPGDTAECGVFNGAGSYLMCRVNQKTSVQKRTHYMFDSFAGLSEPSRYDGRFWKAGDMRCDMATVQKKMEEMVNFSMHKGWIPERFADVHTCTFAFVHIDVDLYGPTRDSIEFFYPRMNDGGIIVCDDYGLTSCPGATLAIDRYLKNKSEKMISLDSGGGFFIKGRRTIPPLEGNSPFEAEG